MKLIIDDKYQITSDSLQYVLQRRMEKKEIKTDPTTGLPEDKYYYVNVGYYGKINHALQAYKELQIRNSNVGTIEELMTLIKDIDKKIEKFLGGN